MYILSGSWPRISRTSISGGQPKGSGSSQKAGHIPLPFGTRQRISKRPYSDLYFIRLMAQNLEDIDFRRPAQGIGQQPESRPHSFAFRNAAANFETPVFRSIFYQAHGPESRGHRFPAASPRDRAAARKPATFLCLSERGSEFRNARIPIYILSGSWPRISRTSISGGQPKGSGSSQKAGHIPLPFGTRQRISKRPYSDLYFIRLMAQNLEDIDFRRPAQGIGQQPESRPHSFAFRNAAANFETPVF